MNDGQIFIVLGILFRNNHNKNVILKNFNFYPYGALTEDYFELIKPNYEDFIEHTKANYERCQNKIVVVPLSTNFYFSLLLFYNLQIFSLVFGLYHCTDENKSNLRKRYNLLEEELKKKCD